MQPYRVRPRRVRPVRWQIKGCQTTEPRTFDSGFSGKVNLSTLSLWYTYVPTYYPVCTLYYLVRVSPLCTTKLDKPSGKCLRCIAPAAAMVDEFE
jgi:hypothetical protein